MNAGNHSAHQLRQGHIGVIRTVPLSLTSTGHAPFLKSNQRDIAWRACESAGVKVKYDSRVCSVGAFIFHKCLRRIKPSQTFAINQRVILLSTPLAFNNIKRRISWPDCFFKNCTLCAKEYNSVLALLKVHCFCYRKRYSVGVILMKGFKCGQFRIPLLCTESVVRFQWHTNTTQGASNSVAVYVNTKKSIFKIIKTHCIVHSCLFLYTGSIYMDRNMKSALFWGSYMRLGIEFGVIVVLKVYYRRYTVVSTSCKTYYREMAGENININLDDREYFDALLQDSLFWYLWHSTFCSKALHFNLLRFGEKQK